MPVVVNLQMNIAMPEQVLPAFAAATETKCNALLRWLKKDNHLRDDPAWHALRKHLQYQGRVNFENKYHPEKPIRLPQQRTITQVVLRNAKAFSGLRFV